MNITCYECGQAGHIWTNCPRLTKVRTAAIRADGTEDPKMDPQEDGSRSMINYGTHATIKIGCKVVEEYFDIVNVEHYDTILGTPFLRKMGIVLDFRSPGMARVGNKVITTGKVFFDELKDTDNNIATKGNIIQSSGAALDRE